MSLTILAAALALPAAPSAASAEPGVTVVVARSEAGAIEVAYALPAGCTRLPFLKTGPGAGRIRSRWQPLEGGGSSGSDALVRERGSPSRLRFRVPVTSDKVTGYPGAFPVGEAVYVHMSNYAVGTACGPVLYRFAAAGSIETARAAFDREAAADSDAPALLFLNRRSADRLDYLDPALSPEAAGRIGEVANATAGFLRRRMPKAAYTRPIIAAALAKEPGGPNIGGSAGEILLLTLFNWPVAPSPEQQRAMIKLVAHEMSHRFQIRDAVDGYRDSRLIHEGGAEFLRWTVSLRQGWLTPDQAGRELDDALAICMLATRGRPWRDLSAEEIAVNRLEYSCGLPAYVYALAARQGRGSPFARIDDFYQRLRAGARPDFATAIECGTVHCRPRILPALLSGATAMPDQWSASLEASGLARRHEPSRSQIDAMMLQAVTDLIKEDCGGDSSITPTPETLLIDGLGKCRTVRADIVVDRVEGEPLFGVGAALPAMIAACRARGSVSLGLKGAGSLALPCRSPYRPTTHFYAADMRKIALQLAR